MEQRLRLVTLGVKDLATSRAFYQRLGWKESPASNAEVAFLQCGGLVFALWGREALADDAGVQADGTGFASISLAHNVRGKEDVDAMLKDAEKAGARILKRARRRPGAAAPDTSRTPTASPGKSLGTPDSGLCRTVASGCLSDPPPRDAVAPRLTRCRQAPNSIISNN